MSMTVEEFEKSKHKGIFSISTGSEIYGEITYEGSDTCLYLIDQQIDGEYWKDRFPKTIKGNLFDSTKVTLFKCILKQRNIKGFSSSATYHHVKWFPHFVIHGDTHVEPEENIFTTANILIEDSNAIFSNFDAFGHLFGVETIIDQVAKIQSERLGRKILLGANSEFFYWDGNLEIFSCDTVIGKISAMYLPTIQHGGSSGIKIENKIVISITFKESIDFNKTISYAMKLFRFIEVLVGRKQELKSLQLGIESDTECPRLVNVYWSNPPTKTSLKKQEPLCAGDGLLEAVSQSDEFSKVLANWLKRDQDWHIARERFSNSFTKQIYDIDRLVGSANMFDILPSSAIPLDLPVCENLNSVVQACKNMFKELPNSPERNSILSALGRIGKSQLKQKIRHRIKFIDEVVGENFPSLVFVADQAVDCRNFYVHGSNLKFDYSEHIDILIFFSDTLEFIFAASDLIESGWDIKSWIKTPSCLVHPFDIYRFNYLENLRTLQELTQRP